MVFINLPVADVAVAGSFYTDLGFRMDPAFCGEDNAAILVEDNVVLMLLAEPRFQGFIVGPISPRDATEVLVCLSAGSRDEVDALCDRALASGGSAWTPPQEHGDAMYGRSFRDPDGHVIEVVWMDAQAMMGAAPGDASAAAG